MKFNRLSLCAGLLCLAGCASTYPPTNFLKNSPSLTEGNHFRREYVRPGVNFMSYDKVQVLPVTLDFFENTDRVDHSVLPALAKIMREEFEKALAQGRTVISPDDAPDAKTLVIRPALVNTSASYNFIDIGSLVIGGAVTSGTTSVEIAVEDGLSGQILAAAAEKRKSKGRGLQREGKDTTVTSLPHAEIASRKWAKQLARLLAAS